MYSVFGNPIAMEGIATGIASMGLEVERLDESVWPVIAYISVPESSEFLNARGEEVAGVTLVKRVKKLLSESFRIKYRIRTGERWTKAMSRQVEADRKRKMYENWI